MDALDEIIEAADVVMIARGDLGVEIGDAELPAVQKRIIQIARSMDRVVITATQMMQSMIESPIPTRAEVFDVANAVIDGTDAVMLSAETAAGSIRPRSSRPWTGSVRRRAPAHGQAHPSGVALCVSSAPTRRLPRPPCIRPTSLGVKAIAALTESGATPLWMSRISSGIPIYAMTRHVETRRKVTLYRGVYPVSFDVTTQHHRQR